MKTPPSIAKWKPAFPMSTPPILHTTNIWTTTFGLPTNISRRYVKPKEEIRTGDKPSRNYLPNRSNPNQCKSCLNVASRKSARIFRTRRQSLSRQISPYHPRYNAIQQYQRAIQPLCRCQPITAGGHSRQDYQPKPATEKHKGKVIYVDFWSSWCVPCREEMVPSAKLRELYKGKDVAFVYLAYKDTKSSWKKAAKQEGLAEIENNFIITNSKTARPWKQ